MELTSLKMIKKGALLGVASVSMKEWNDFYIKNISIFQKDKNRWIAFPSDSYEKDGVTKYSSKCGFSNPEDFKKFQNQFFEEFDNFFNKQDNQQTKDNLDLDNLPF